MGCCLSLNGGKSGHHHEKGRRGQKEIEEVERKRSGVEEKIIICKILCYMSKKKTNCFALQYRRLEVYTFPLYKTPTGWNDTLMVRFVILSKKYTFVLIDSKALPDILEECLKCNIKYTKPKFFTPHSFSIQCLII